MNVVRIVLQVLLVLSSFFLIMSILLHKGKGGGLSDMFGGGISSSAGSSGVAERNLDRITVAVAIIWTITIVGLGLVAKLRRALRTRRIRPSIPPLIRVETSWTGGCAATSPTYVSSVG